jgi:DNA-binding LacI/PurR family transcriptional regulator
MLLNLGVAEENITTYNSVNDKAPLELINVIKTASETNRIGIFCFHDVIALSIYSDIKKYKKNIPQEIGIVGFDNLSISDILTPRLTSVYYNFNELASLAFHTAISSINNESAPIVKNVTVPSLIIKESTKKTINSF